MAEPKPIALQIKTPVDKKDPTFVVESLSGTEQISGLFHYQLSLQSTDSAVAADKILGKSVTVTIVFGDSKKRYINGIVSRFVQADTAVPTTTYHIDLVPTLWLLTQTANCKIFQSKKVTDILSDVFKGAATVTFDDKTTATYKEKDYCVQYRESDFDFASRLMEEAGIYYYFTHKDGSHTMVLVDDKSKHEACPDMATAKMRKDDISGDDLVDRCEMQEQVTANGFSTTDYNFETPSTSLAAKTEGANKPKLLVYDYPGHYQAASDGTALTKLRQQAEVLPGKTLTGESGCRGFIAGSYFELKDHPRKDLNAKYVIHSLSIEATQDGYANAFTAFPKDTQFRQPLLTPRPRIPGTQTALVVGKSGEEIWTDKYGRIKVQFHWDELGKKDEKSSCWVRVTQAWAGKGWGTLFTPRMGAEVIVSFLDGDPDRPIVTGTVYNGEQTVPYTLPSKQTTSTILTRSSKQGSAGNELRFDDTKDSEEVYVHAQKDMTVEIENDRTETVKAKETVTVKKTRNLTVEDDETHTNKKKFTHKVTGDYSLTVDGDLKITVSGDITINGSKDVTMKSGTASTIQAGTAMTVKSGTTLETNAGATATHKASAPMSLKAPMIKLN